MSGGGMGRGLRKRNSKEISHSTAQNYRRLGIVLEKGIMLVLTVWKLEESLKNYIKTLWDPVSHFSSAAGIFHPSHSTAWVCALRRGWSKAMSPGTLGTVEGRGVIIGHFLLQGIFLTQGLNPGLLHCKWMPLQSELLALKKDILLTHCHLLRCITPVPLVLLPVKSWTLVHGFHPVSN